MKQKLKITFKIISNTLIILVVILAFLLHGIRLFGLEPYTVLSGSMESVYPTGSLIYVRKVDPARLKVGDIITFRLASGTVATHRIVELLPNDQDPSEPLFRTKGDENDVADGAPVAGDSVIGSPLFGIPYLGVLAAYVSSPSGKYIMIIVALSLILMEILISLAFGDKKSKEKENLQ